MWSAGTPTSRGSPRTPSHPTLSPSGGDYHDDCDMDDCVDDDVEEDKEDCDN